MVSDSGPHRVGLNELETVLGHTFVNPVLLQQAVVHSSYCYHHPEYRGGHNERLEHLGDVVLELIVTDYLYHHCPNGEGDLTLWRSHLVNAKNLKAVANNIGLGRWIRVGSDQDEHLLTRSNSGVQADAIEAIIGALYLDGGVEAAKKFVAKHFLSTLPDVRRVRPTIDPKGRFQDRCLKTYGVNPTYRILLEWGPRSNPMFQAGVFIGREEIARGTGSSKKEAEVEAANKGLKKKGW